MRLCCKFTKRKPQTRVGWTTTFALGCLRKALKNPLLVFNRDSFALVNNSQPQVRGVTLFEASTGQGNNCIGWAML